jgi:PKHD-type hydroxylase
MVAITWIESRVRDPVNRKMLYEMKTSLGAIERAHGGGPELLKLRSIYNQLCRNWLE